MLNVFTDGGARGNPGPAAIGVYITDDHNDKVHSFGKTIGIATNNVAEYKAVIEALAWIIEHLKREKEKHDKIHFFLDSQLVVSQLTGLFKIKNAHLRALLFEIRQKEIEINLPIVFSYIPREKNKKADALVNMALDKTLHTSLQ